MENSQQKLIDIMFEIGLNIKDNPVLQRKSNEELAAWIRKQLSLYGFETEPIGSSWGVLVKIIKKLLYESNRC